MSVTFVLDGESTHPEDLGDPEQCRALMAIMKMFEENVGGLVCAEHGQYANVTISGKSLETSRVSVESCCQVFVDAVRARLEE